MFSGSFRDDSEQPGVDGRDAVRGSSDITQRRSARQGLRGHVRRSDRCARQPVVLRRRPLREHARAADAAQRRRTAYNSATTNKRGELQAHRHAVAADQTVQGSFIDNATEQTRSAPARRRLDAAHRSMRRERCPTTCSWSTTTACCRRELFATAQCSRKNQSFEEAGGTSTAIIDSPFRTIGVATGVPATLDLQRAVLRRAPIPEDRNNHQVTGSLSYFLTTPRFGSHDIKGGVEDFAATSTGGNSQSSTGYVFDTDYLLGADGAARRSTPTAASCRVFVPGVTSSRTGSRRAARRIDINDDVVLRAGPLGRPAGLTLDLGVRFETVRSEATGDIVGVDTDDARAAAGGELRHRGRRALDRAGDLRALRRQVQRGAVRRQHQRRPTRRWSLRLLAARPARASTSRPGFDPANYRLLDGSFPTANVFFEDGLSSPLTKEFTASVGGEFGERGSTPRRRSCDRVDEPASSRTSSRRTTRQDRGDPRRRELRHASTTSSTATPTSL